MGMDMGATIQNLMGMSMTFQNEYGYEYNSTRPKPAPCPSLLIGGIFIYDNILCATIAHHNPYSARHHLSSYQETITL